MRSVCVEDLLMAGGNRLGLQPIAGMAGSGRPISSAKVQRPGRGLRKEPLQLRANRLLILGRDEIQFIQGLSSNRRKILLRELILLDMPCIILEGSHPVPDDLRAFAHRHAIPMLGTHLSGYRVTRNLQEILKEILRPGFHLQGVLMQVFDVGVLIIGKSGIGKSECALDLITRGHALVADDMVELDSEHPGRLVGASPELIRHHMEVRGLGIINILELFGTRAVAESSSVDLIVELLEWDHSLYMDRTGLTQTTYTILDTDVPMLRIPVSLNRNLAIILEVAVRNHLLQKRGIRPLEQLERRIESTLRSKGSS